jgi:hypothetical protein
MFDESKQARSVSRLFVDDGMYARSPSLYLHICVYVFVCINRRRFSPSSMYDEVICKTSFQLLDRFIIIISFFEKT